MLARQSPEDPPIDYSDAALIEVLDRHEGTPRMLPGGHFFINTWAILS